MFWQMGIMGLTAYGLYKKTYREEIKFKRTLQEIVEKGEGFFNRQMETLKVNKVEATSYGYEATIGVPYGISFEFLEDKKELFESNFGAKEVILKRDTENSMVNMSVITKPLQDIKFKTTELKPYEIYVGYNHKEHIILDLNTFPHLLISGATGTGKSRLMLVILTNLIATHKKDIELYMAQIRKGDLAVFEDCKQVKYFAKSLESTCNILEYINKMCIERDKKIERYIKKGIYNIQDWNKRFKNNSMKYVYIVTDEFTFFMLSKADTKKERALKGKCLAYIKNIVLSGRSTGIFLFTSLQRPTKNSIPQDIKAQLNIRVSFKQLDDPSSIAVLGNGHATGLEVREAIIQTNKEEHIKVPFIAHNILMKNIKESIEKNHKFIKLGTDGITLPKLNKLNNAPHITSLNINRCDKSIEDKKEPQRANMSHAKEKLKEVAAETTRENGVIDISKFKGVLTNANKKG